MSSRIRIGAIVVGFVFVAALPAVSFAHQWHGHPVYHQPRHRGGDGCSHHGHHYYKPFAHRRGHGKRHFAPQHGLNTLHFRWSTSGTHIGVVLNVPVHRTRTIKHVQGAQYSRGQVRMQKVRNGPSRRRK